MNNPGTNWHVIVNPNAGKGKGEKDWNEISTLLAQNGFRFSHSFTKGKYHAAELVSDAIHDGMKKFIVVGGDGTLNEVVNGIFTQDIIPPAEVKLGMIPVGTGNDWGRMFHIPSDYMGAISILKNEKTFLQDIGIVQYAGGKNRKSRYFINIAGLGFDARVVQKANRQKDEGKGGMLLYFLTIFATLMSYKSTRVTLNVDGTNVLDDDVLSLSLGIGKYAGGGMSQTPDANPDDGMIDVTVIKHMSKVRVIASLKKLYDGNILKHSRIEGFLGRKIRIESNPPIFAEADGESLGKTPVEFTILPRSLHVIIGRL
jgi:YegS/Rv2252/BmrU family lipid kinase